MFFGKKKEKEKTEAPATIQTEDDSRSELSEFFEHTSNIINPQEEPQVPEAPPEPPLEITLPDQYDSDLLFKTLIEHNGSDIHLAVGSPPIFRIKGDMIKANAKILTEEKMRKMMLPLVKYEMLETFEITGNLDFSLEIKDLARFRGNFLKQYNGMGAVFRVIPTKVPSIDDMKMPPILKKIALFKRGLVIVTGPTGSGKSTTMAAMINHINQNRNAHIITIEDPLEFTHHNNQCIIDHREIGANAVSFEDAIRSAIREDPDVILVGEMRDLETISLAIKAAEMGILVLGTLHTNSASKTIDRIIDVFPAKEQEQIRAMLSESIKAVIAQQLLKSKDGKGRIAALEVLISSPALSNIIREGKTTLIDGLIQTGKNDGMQTMDDTLAIYVKDGKVKLEDALERMHDTSVLKRYNVNVN